MSCRFCTKFIMVGFGFHFEECPPLIEKDQGWVMKRHQCDLSSTANCWNLSDPWSNQRVMSPSPPSQRPRNVHIMPPTQHRSVKITLRLPIGGRPAVVMRQSRQITRFSTTSMAIHIEKWSFIYINFPQRMTCVILTYQICSFEHVK